MMMGVVSLFLVCWLPYHTYFITANVFPAINYTHYIQVDPFAKHYNKYQL